MKTELDVRRELKEVRSLLEGARRSGREDADMLYGAQQALGWVLDQLRSPSDMEKCILDVAGEWHRQEQLDK